MKTLAAVCMAVLIFGSVALSQDQPSTPNRAPLLLVQQIPLPNVGGRIDHFTFDGKRKRVIGAALGNNTVEIVDTFAGRDIHSITVSICRNASPAIGSTCRSSSLRVTVTYQCPSRP